MKTLLVPLCSTLITHNQNETRYLTHCRNIAHILAHTESIKYAQVRIEEYCKITGIELDKGDGNE